MCGGEDIYIYIYIYICSDLWINLDEGNHFEDLAVDGMIILKLMLQ
jgi:hypothetical protein